MDTTSTLRRSETIAPYLPFKTFQSAVQNLRAHGLPDIVDKTTWHSQSEGMKNLIFGAFKFFNLLDDAGKTQPSLRLLKDAAENSAEEKALLASMLRAAYPKAFDLPLDAATPGQLAEAIGTHGVSGATRERAVRFFLKAALFSGITVSSRLTVKLHTKGDDAATIAENGNSTPSPAQGRVARKKRRQSAIPHTADSAYAVPDSSGAVNVKTIELRNIGGSLTLSGTFNTFDLDGDERKLVFDITDLMKAYERKKSDVATS